MSTVLPEPKEPEIPQLIKYTRNDVERLADILALVTVAWFVAAAASWLGKDNFIVALAMLGAAYFLVKKYDSPVRSFLRQIFEEILDALFQLVNLIYAFLYMAYTYWGGRLLSMILHIVLWMVAGWVFERLFQYPGVRTLFETLTQAIRQTFEFALSLLNGVRTFAQNLDFWVREQVDRLFGAIGNLAVQVTEQLGALRDFVLDQISFQISQTRQDLLAFWNQSITQILGRLDAQRIALERAIKDTGEWLFAQIGDVRVQIGDLVLQIPLLSMYLAWLTAQNEALRTVEAAQVAFASIPTEPVQTTDTIPVALLWVLEDVALAVEGTHPVDQLNEAFQTAREAIAETAARFGPYLAA